jgi:hypothetical protein
MRPKDRAADEKKTLLPAIGKDLLAEVAKLTADS